MRVSWWVEYSAKFIVVVFGELTTILAVIQVLPLMTPSSAIMLLIFLIIFMVSFMLVFLVEVNRSKPRKGNGPSGPPLA